MYTAGTTEASTDAGTRMHTGGTIYFPTVASTDAGSRMQAVMGTIITVSLLCGVAKLF